MKFMLGIIPQTEIFCFFFYLQNQKSPKANFSNFLIFHVRKIVSRQLFIVFSSLLAVVHGNVLIIFHGLIFFCVTDENHIFPDLSVKSVENA